MNTISKAVIFLSIFLLIFFIWGTKQVSESPIVIDPGIKTSEAELNEDVKVLHYSQNNPKGFIVLTSAKKDILIRTLQDDKAIDFAEQNMGEIICLKYSVVNFDSGMVLYKYIDAKSNPCKTPIAK